MKFINLALLLMLCNAGLAQISKGNTFKRIDKESSVTTFGSGSTAMTNDISSTSYYDDEVIKEEGNVLTLKSTLSRIKAEFSGMGQTMVIDTKDKDMTNPQSIQLLKKIGESTEILFNKKGYVINKIKEKSDDENALESLMEENAGITLFLPSESILSKKEKDTWTDSINEEGVKLIKTYTVTGIKNNVISLSLKGNIDIDTKSEIQGQKADIKMKGSFSGKSSYALETGMLQKAENFNTLSGTIEIGGVPMPIHIKGNVSSEYEKEKKK